MKVRGAAEIVQIEVGKLQVQCGSQIGEKLALLRKRKNYGDAGGLA